MSERENGFECDGGCYGGHAELNEEGDSFWVLAVGTWHLARKKKELCVLLKSLSSKFLIFSVF